MSRENVELALAWQPDPDANIAELIRDDLSWAAASSAMAAAVSEDFEVRIHGVPGFEGAAWHGVEGLRSGWLEWLSPWESYRAQVDETVDLGDRVLILVRDFGRRHGGTAEVAVTGANLSTFRDGKLARIDFFLDRAAALRAVGLDDRSQREKDG
jgi:ketosteroid isomerase-like protein